MPLECPTMPDFLSNEKYKEVSINKAENGFIIKVGCKTFVETSWDRAQRCLAEYWKDPVAAENKYCGK